MARDILDKRFASQIVGELEMSQIRDRRIDEWKLYRIYNGDGRVYTDERLQELYPQSHQSMHTADLNILKQVVDVVSKAYTHGAVRRLEKEQESNTLSEVYKHFHYEAKLHLMDKTFNRHNYTAVWLTPRSYSDGTEKIDLEVLNPWEFNVVRNQVSGEVEVVILNYPDINVTKTSTNDGFEQVVAEHQGDTSAQSRLYAFWTKDQHAVWRVQDVKGHARGGNNSGSELHLELVPMEDNPNNVNPLGMLPFVFVWKEDAIDLPVLNDMGDFTVEINAMFSGLLTASAKQGFGQLVVSHPDNYKVETVHTGITTAIDLPQPPEEIGGAVTADYINANPDLSGQLQTYSSYITGKLREWGIKGADVLSASNVKEFSSGFDRLLSKADVMDYVDSNQEMYMVVEQKMYKILKRYSELGMLIIDSKRVRFTSNDLMVYFKKPKVMISDMEMLNNIEKQLQLGLIEEWEKYVILDPNLTEDQAKEKLDRINEEKQAKVKEFMGGMIDGGRNEEDQSEPRQDRPEFTRQGEEERGQ